MGRTCQPHARRPHPQRLKYGELEQGTRATERPKFNYKDVLKRDLRSTDINILTWEQSATDRTAWKQIVHAGIFAHEAKRAEASLEKRQRRKDPKPPAGENTWEYRCRGCSRDCHSEIGLFSHRRVCIKQQLETWMGAHPLSLETQGAIDWLIDW